jgi:membrane protease YdiL (CAAX protease family)
VLSPKPWKLESIVRLLLKLFICMCAGWLLIGVLYAKVQAGRGRANLAAVAIVAVVCLGAAFVLLRKPWTAENFLFRAVSALTVFYAGLVLTAWAQHLAGALTGTPSVPQMVIAMLSLQGATIVLVTLFLKEQGSSWREAFGLSHNTRRAIATGILVACLFLPIAWLLKSVSERGIEHFSHTRASQQESVETIRVASGWAHRVLLAAVTLVLAPIGEETLFRGILYSAIRQIGFRRLAFWVNSVAFALIHFNAGAFLPLLVLAMILTVLYEKTDNLLAPIAAHATFNGIEFVAIYLFANQSG